MSIEGVLFYGITIPENDPGWRRVSDKYEHETGRMLMEHFHSELMKDAAWIKRFDQFPGDYTTALMQEFRAENIFGGCRINAYGDLGLGDGRYYVAVCGTEVTGRVQGTLVDPEIFNSPSRREWDARLKRFCKRLGLGFAQPQWQLAFWGSGAAGMLLYGIVLNDEEDAAWAELFEAHNRKQSEVTKAVAEQKQVKVKHPAFGCAVVGKSWSWFVTPLDSYVLTTGFDAKPIESLTVKPEWNESLKKFCEFFELGKHETGWYVSFVEDKGYRGHQLVVR